MTDRPTHSHHTLLFSSTGQRYYSWRLRVPPSPDLTLPCSAHIIPVAPLHIPAGCPNPADSLPASPRPSSPSSSAASRAPRAATNAVEARPHRRRSFSPRCETELPPRHKHRAVPSTIPPSTSYQGTPRACRYRLRGPFNFLLPPATTT